jgi:phosphohistidine swiveling domain-containing protein
MTWITRWAGSYTFISCSYWASQYALSLKRVLGKGLETTLFIHREGTASFLVKKEELDAFGTFLAEKTIKNKNDAKKLLAKLKKNTDVIMKLMDDMEGDILTAEQYASFHKSFDIHLAYHNFMKKTVDYLPQEELQELLPLFQDARIYSEAVYSRTEKFFRSLAKAISERENYHEKALACLTQEEIEIYITSKILPNEKELLDRFTASAILFENGNSHILTGEEVTQLESKIFQANNEGKLQGTIAHTGKIQGRCRVIHDPFKEYEFNEGDILVTGMTRPEFIPFLEKASAIVTDAGGVLCHAAITAREMRKPCVVGTESATKIFQDGDIIEVDAIQGIVRKL